MAIQLFTLDDANPPTWLSVKSGSTTQEFNSVVSFNISEGATFGQGTSDGIRTVQSTYGDNEVITVTLNTKNPVQANGLRVTDYGTLVLKGIKRKPRNDDTTADVTVTYTCDEATIISINKDIVHEGASAGNITFECVSSDGSSIFAVS